VKVDVNVGVKVKVNVKGAFKSVWVLVLLALANLCTANEAAIERDDQINQKVDRLFATINQRLSHMQSVAAYKWLNDLAIEHPQREQKVIASALDQAQQLGLDPTAVDEFFSIQIEAAKEIQRYWFGRWQAGLGVDHVAGLSKDLSAEIRPALIRLGAEITDSLLDSEYILNNPRYQRLLMERGRALINIEGVSEESKALLVKSLQKVERLAEASGHTLAHVLSSGVLRVGTTGDYFPFSEFVVREDRYRGIDIDLAASLADSLGVELRLIHTSWPSLLTDLEHNKFDIAMSGVSIKLFRLRQGLFSQAYHQGGKTPIALCKHKARFDSLKKIDQSGTRLIVNPGGTNQRFVDAHIKRAEINVFDNNQTIFKEIALGRADVMITDAIEVAVQSQHNPLLCATMPSKTLDHSEKGFLMHQDMIWKNYVDTWLYQLRRDAHLSQVFSRYVEPVPVL